MGEVSTEVERLGVPSDENNRYSHRLRRTE